MNFGSNVNNNYIVFGETLSAQMNGDDFRNKNEKPNARQRRPKKIFDFRQMFAQRSTLGRNVFSERPDARCIVNEK